MIKPLGVIVGFAVVMLVVLGIMLFMMLSVLGVVLVMLFGVIVVMVSVIVVHGHNNIPLGFE